MSQADDEKKNCKLDLKISILVASIEMARTTDYNFLIRRIIMILDLFFFL
jgi:hypothetical protein